jgi:DNA polymerase I-like protein with 3'-5' exonuclease and polymerase domains
MGMSLYEVGLGKQLAAFDCETTGSALHHGVLPFMVCFTFEDRRQLTYEWEVDVYTRVPRIDPGEIAEIVELLNDPQYLWIGHNIKFDVRCIEKAQAQFDDSFWDEVPYRFDPIPFLRKSHDTMSMSHALDNQGSHGLKDLCVRYLDIPEEDVEFLKQEVEHARAYGKQYGWKIANAENCPYEGGSPNGGWWIIDMWIAQEYARLHGSESSVCKTYCLRDTERTLQLFCLLRDELNKQGLWDQYMRNQRVIPVSYKMEQYGVSIHMDTLLSERKRFIRIANECEQKAKEISGRHGVNLNSPESKAIILKEVYGIDELCRKTKSGKATVDKDELEALYTKYEGRLEESTGPSILVDYTDDAGNKKGKFVPRKQVENMLQFVLACMMRQKCFKSANGDLVNYQTKAIGYAYEEELDYYLHPSFNETGTETPRFSSSNPNGQNVQKGKNPFNEEIKGLDLSLRKIFGPVAGRKWWSIDYDQIQLIVLAVLGNEKKAVDFYVNGGDLHEYTHKQLAAFSGWDYNPEDDGQRRVAKEVNFGFRFGAGKKKIEKKTHVVGLYEDLCEAFPEAHRQLREDIKQVEKDGFVTAGGYRLYVPSEQIYSATVYKAQGYEAVIMKRAMVEIDRILEGTDCHMILVVHDELVLDVPEDEDDGTLFLVQAAMEQAAIDEGIPCRTGAKEILTNWAEGKKVPRSRI